MIHVRPEATKDLEAIRELLLAAFDGKAEANLVDKLRRRDVLSHSLVAVQGGSIIGHIAFSEMALEGAAAGLKIMGLGPMAVVPSRQNKGIGSILARRGIEVCRADHVNLIAVLGHPGYYPKFGFRAARNFGLNCDFDVPDEVFMALLLNPAEPLPTGKLRYQREFYQL